MAAIKTLNGSAVGESSLDDATFSFGQSMRPAVLRDAVIMYEANKRQGTVNTLTRRFVNGSGKKFQKQKHTGRARHGDKKAPIFRGGGVAHGPHPRDHSYAMPRKALTRALQVALAGKLRDGQVSRWEDASFDKPSTKDAHVALSALGAVGSALIVSNGPVDEALLLSMRNLQRVKALPASEVSAYDVVYYRNLILLDGALQALVARVGASDGGKAAGSTNDEGGAR
jgi:large subunit ribosomal protein L4